ncbi:MAG: hypothetical protein R3230_00305 [Nitrosopumilaceae archaeon]|nr:hypothetical protein [Nitrosopumilaceae archaeon]
MRYVPEVVASYPAYDVIKPRKCTLTDYPVFKANDTVAVKLKGKRIESIFTFGSVVSYALENNSDPIESYNNALDHGHPLHWLIPNAVMITAQEREKETHYYLELGDEVLFEGIIFRIEEDWNNNLKLVKVCTKNDMHECA